MKNLILTQCTTQLTDAIIHQREDDPEMLIQFSPLLLRSPLTRIRFLSIPASTSNSPNPTRQNPLSASHYSFVQTLSFAAKSSSISIGQQTHSSILKLCLTSNLFIASALLDLYFKCHRFQEAHQLFDEMPHRNEVTWNTLIYGQSQSPNPSLAIRTLKDMILAENVLTPFGVSSVCVAAVRLGDARVGEMVHCFGFKHGFCSNVVVSTSLVDMYSKCDNVGSARMVFDEMEDRNVITWTSLVTGYALDRRPDDAMRLFREMRNRGVVMNRVTFNSLLTSFTVFEDLVHGKQVHCLAIKEGLDSDPFVLVTLVTMYSKCGSSEDFDRICSNVSIQDDQVAYNSVIAGFSHLGNDGKVMEMFLQMRRKSIEVDYFTFTSVLRSIGIFSALHLGRQTHALILKSRYSLIVCVQNGLLSMYARCGLIDDSKKVFSSMYEPDLVSYNALLSCCAHHGHGREIVEIFEEMRRIGVTPNSTTFLSVLSGCGHIGLVDEGLEYFNLMREYGVVAGIEHYTCVVDLLSRAGYINEAESYINSMPIMPNVPIYRALLSACQTHGNVEMAKHAAKCLLDLDPNDPSAHVLLSNVFAADKSWENASVMRRVMWGKGVRKEPACSLIDEKLPVIWAD